jgi:predicted amidohydrolase
MVRVALIQLTTGKDPIRSTEDACHYIKQAAMDGADLISTPETTHMMEMDRKKVLEKAYYEDADPALCKFQALAKELGVWLHLGSLIIKVAEDKLANRSFLIDNQGMIVARYDKIHLFDVDLGGGET